MKKKVENMFFMISSPILLPALVVFAIVKDAMADRKLKKYLHYLKNEDAIDPKDELRICNECLNYVTHSLIMSDGNGPEHIRASEFLLYHRKNELEQAVKL